MSKRYSKYLPLSIFLSDLAVLNIAFYSAHYLVFNTVYMQFPSIAFLLLVNITWVIMSLFTKNFEVHRPLVLTNSINKFLVTLSYHLLFFFSIVYFAKIADISRAEVVFCYAIYIILMIFQRSLLFFLLDYFRKNGYNHREIMIIGDEKIGKRLIKSFSKHPEYGYDLLEFITDVQVSNLSEKALINKITSKRPDEIFLCYKHIEVELIGLFIAIGEENHIKIKVVSDLILENNHAKLLDYHNLPVIQLSSNPELSLKIRILKRSFDLLFSSAVMSAGLPVFAMLYVITKVTSKGPAFYKQERIGKNGKPFYIYKFRSMHVNAEQAGPQLSKDRDPRITKWGVIIRKTRLDELPQFWNVMKGEMSVVGPRPERQYFIEQIVERTPNYKKLLSLKPGITSIGQVHYGYAENIDEMCNRTRYDLLYLQNINLNADVSIILKTVKVMIQRKGK
ncbi:sugar transferase [Mucilaginibacter sp.]|uniref:sugar transferase n=1 Tax=Mucilaginibacter sp. TaxID=1882438 RepID=UPI003D0A5FC8